MGIVYDNWERLVDATLRREELRMSALRTPTDPSSASPWPSPSPSPSPFHFSVLPGNNGYSAAAASRSEELYLRGDLGFPQFKDFLFFTAQACNEKLHDDRYVAWEQRLGKFTRSSASQKTCTRRLHSQKMQGFQVRLRQVISQLRWIWLPCGDRRR
ncbi:uncharacterized protein LOC113778394 isoform X2 [Coffea eugenioides]|uniref:Uncharacterized protein n=1 Tax=Coffea arabica TaxID=13443 RepID=A0A6P6T977_COFAR|nr:uncharacterized protein LOC113698645 [Coffea arabica]XP_027078113.1 uncharacterized protein LOC113701582 [Coffea arabica]XP_027179595.1 uncharacterized protein LOC113778394 isoform X2 [Coffea eugenioides]